MSPAADLPSGPPRTGLGGRVFTLALFLVGALGALFFIVSVTGPGQWIALSLVLTGLHALGRGRVNPRRSVEGRRRTSDRSLALAARVIVGLFVAGAVYETAAWAALLAWTVPVPVKALVGLLALASLATLARPWRGVQVPLVLPLGLLSTACLLGWAREEWRVECDDVLRATSQPSVRVLVASVDGLSACAPGTFLPLGRYPRKVWESPDGARLVFTTQRAIHEELQPAGTPERITGLLCSAEARPGAPAPTCLLATGKAHNLLEDPAGDRLFVGIMSGLSGRTGGVVAVTRSEPLRELGRIELPQAASMFHDPALDLLGNFGDDGRLLERVRASDLTRFPRDPEVPASFTGPDVVRFDPVTHRGLACVADGPLRTLDGDAFLAVAFDADPFRPRPLAPSSRYPSSWLALSWGCDWDPSHTRDYVNVPTLGQLVTIEHETGRVLDRAFVGFGMRPLLFDPARRRLYLGDFLRGDVLAVEPDTGRIRSTWFAGRYVRDLVLTRDGRALLVTSNLGIVRIELD